MNSGTSSGRKMMPNPRQVAPSTTARPPPATALSILPRWRQSSAGLSASNENPTADDDEGREGSTSPSRSLFLCCRGLTSLLQIQGLETMWGLRSLNVHMNAIQRVEGLGGLRRLVELDLSANEIHELDARDGFPGLVSLKRLNLSSNFLRVLPEGVFASLRSLEWIALGFNRLEDVAGLRSIPARAPLAYVDVGGNRLGAIAQVVDGLHAHRGHLRELRLLIPAAAGGRAGAAAAPGLPQTPLAERIGVERIAASVFVLAENPFWRGPFDPAYEAVPRSFPRLRVLDGVGLAVEARAGGGGPPAIGEKTAIGEGPSLRLGPPSRWPGGLRGLVKSTGAQRPPPRRGPPTSETNAAKKKEEKEEEEEGGGIVRSPLTTSASSSSSTSSESSRAGEAGIAAGPPTPPTERLRELEEALRQCREEKELALLRAAGGEEKLRLRAAMEDDLRRQLDLARRRAEEIDAGSTARVRLLNSQVAALKDELNRRSHEVSILHKKHEAALEEQKRRLREQMESTRREREAAFVKKIEAEALERERARCETEAEAKGRFLSEMDERRRELAAKREELAHLDRKLRASNEALAKAHQDQVKMRSFFDLQAEELRARHDLELKALTWCGDRENKTSEVSSTESVERGMDLNQFFLGALHILLSERNQLWQDWEKYQQHCQTHCRAIQEQSTEALQHAEAELQRLARELDHARGREEKMRKATPAMKVSKAMRDAAVDPILTTATNSRADGEVGGAEEILVEVVQLPSAQAATTRDWKEVSERLRGELERLRAAHEVTVQTELATAKENARLLESTADLERRLQTADDGHRLEKENLLRTLHNLQADIENKTAALETLEEEAQAKIGEKRRRIAELEGLAESLQDAQEKQLESHVKFREEAAARAKELEAACHALRDEKRQHEGETHDLKARLSELEKGAAACIQLQRLEQQHQKEKSRLMEAIRIARDQLLRLHHASSALAQQNEEKDAALRRKELELERCRTELEEAQKNSRAKQKATLEMLSQMILTDK